MSLYFLAKAYNLYRYVPTSQSDVIVVSSEDDHIVLDKSGSTDETDRDKNAIRKPCV
jgi:hypothetical protein